MFRELFGGFREVQKQIHSNWSAGRKFGPETFRKQGRNLKNSKENFATESLGFAFKIIMKIQKRLDAKSLSVFIQVSGHPLTLQLLLVTRRLTTISPTGPTSVAVCPAVLLITVQILSLEILSLFHFKHPTIKDPKSDEFQSCYRINAMT